MKSATAGEDIIKTLLQCTDTMGVGLTKLVSVITDSVPAIIGKNKGAVALLIQQNMNLEH